MKKFTVILCIFIFSVILFKPVNSYAYEINHSLANNQTSGNMIDNFGQDQDCNGLLGNPDDENSVAWLIQTILNYLRIIGPILVLVLSSIDFAKVIINSDDDALAKAKKTLIRRLILAGLLFFVPTIVNVLLSIFGIYGDPTCGLH